MLSYFYFRFLEVRENVGDASGLDSVCHTYLKLHLRDLLGFIIIKSIDFRFFFLKKRRES